LHTKLDYWIEHESELKSAKAPYLDKAQNYAFSASVEKARSHYQSVIEAH